MQTAELKKIIIDQKEEAEEFFKRENVIERDVDLVMLKSFLKHPNALLISGLRRCGKSVLSQIILKDEKYGYINFDDERLASFEADDFNRLLQAFYEIFDKEPDYFIFDEVQNVPHWELFINRLRRTKRIIVTGSNARLLSGELSTFLTGRYVDFTLFPFSFREFLRIKGIDPNKENLYSTKTVAKIKKLLAEYLEIGGLPETYKFGKTIIKKTYGDIINRDILYRNKVKNKTTFKELANYLTANFGQEISYSKLRNIFSIKNVHTIKNYTDYLASSFLIFILEKFSYKLKQQVMAAKKVYSIDTGIVNAMAFQFSPNGGRLAENAVLIELLRRKSYFDEDISVYFWKDYMNREVDFVVKKGRKVVRLIQVSTNLADLKTKERELKSLVEAGKELKCRNLLVLSDDKEGEEKFRGKKIVFVPLWKWLTQ